MHNLHKISVFFMQIMHKAALQLIGAALQLIGAALQLIGKEICFRPLARASFR